MGRISICYAGMFAAGNPVLWTTESRFYCFWFTGSGFNILRSMWIFLGFGRLGARVVSLVTLLPGCFAFEAVRVYQTMVHNFLEVLQSRCTGIRTQPGSLVTLKLDAFFSTRRLNHGQNHSGFLVRLDCGPTLLQKPFAHQSGPTASCFKICQHLAP